MTERRVNNRIIRVVKGDITERDVDAIVNAANNYLKHGGGVAGAIVKKGGSIIQEESDKIGYVATGQAAITSAGALKAKYVIHAVGPRWGEGDEEIKLKNAIINSLKLAEEKSLKSISFPAISSGIFGCPKDMVANILINTAYDYLKTTQNSSVTEIEFCLFDEDTFTLFSETLEKLPD